MYEDGIRYRLSSKFLLASDILKENVVMHSKNIIATLKLTSHFLLEYFHVWSFHFISFAPSFNYTGIFFDLPKTTRTTFFAKSENEIWDLKNNSRGKVN